MGMSACKMHLGKAAAWVEVRGEDSFPFLQGQFSNDLRRSGDGPATYGLWLDRKGKVLADSFVLQNDPEHFFLFTYHSPARTVLGRLDPYIVADDVELTDGSADMAVIALWGESVSAVLATAGLPMPDENCFVRSENLFIVSGRRSREPNVDIICPSATETVNLLSARLLKAGATTTDATELERERIRSAIPAIPADVGPQELPQEGSLEGDALSHTKGCYTGQEVMARIRSMGQVRRRLMQVCIRDPDTRSGAPLFHVEKEIGRIKTIAEGDPLLGMALIRLDALDQATSFSLGPEGLPTVDICNNNPNT